MLGLSHRGGVPQLDLRPADLEAVHLGALSGNDSTALYLQGMVVGAAALRYRKGQGRDTFRLVKAQAMASWLRALSSSWRTNAGGPERSADAWRYWVEVLFLAEAVPFATATQCAMGPAGRPCGSSGEGCLETSAKAPHREERPPRTVR